MGKLTRGHILEAAVWLALAAIGFYYSFDFNQEISTYKFGAVGWPRAVLALIVVAALANLYWHYRNGDDYGEAEVPGSKATDETSAAGGSSIKLGDPAFSSETSFAYYGRIVPILILPFLYAYFLQGVGFYALTPPFIAAVIFVMGERNLAWLLGVTALVYGLLLFLFAKVLFVGLPVGIWHPYYDYSQWLIPVIQESQFLEFLGLFAVIPLAIFAIITAKDDMSTGAALLRTALVYAILFALGTGAAFLLAGRENMFVLFDVLAWPLKLFG